jgi:uncharacterized protein (TIGR02284 family)
MITNDDKALLVLENLIRAGRDAEQGFLAAADSVPEPELVQVFADYAVQRAKFVVELQDRVRTLRGDPEQYGTIGGEVHRAWLGLRAAIDSNEVHAILAECERGEDMAVRLYRDALKERDVDAQTREIVQRQYEAVEAAHARIRQLRDSATYAHR